MNRLPKVLHTRLDEAISRCNNVMNRILGQRLGNVGEKMEVTHNVKWFNVT
jgi:hypothetical protein